MRFIHLTILLALAQTLSSQTIAERLDSVAISFNLAGMSTATVCHGEISWLGHYGYSDIDDAIEVVDETRYRIASVSKTITAMGVMWLWQEGMLLLDEDISSYLGFEVVNPAFPDKAITVRMLLNHNSSIIDGATYPDFLSDSYNLDTPPSVSELLLTDGSYYSNSTFLGYEPGSWFSYSNINYGLLGTIIEAVSGQRFDEFMKDNILLPAGVLGSYNIQDLPELEHLAVLYRKELGFWVAQADHYNGIYPPARDLTDYVPGTNGLLFAPQGGLRVSAHELALLMRCLIPDDRLDGAGPLHKPALDTMITSSWIYNGSNGNSYYGLFQAWGLGLHKPTNDPGNDLLYDGLNLSGHPGEAYGLVSDMYFSAEDELGVIVLISGCGEGYNPGLYSAWYEVEEAILKVLFEESIEPCLSPLVVQTPPISQGAYYDAQSSNLVFRANGDYQLFDMYGRMVYSFSIQDHNRTISLARLPAGLYWLKNSSHVLNFIIF